MPKWRNGRRTALKMLRDLSHEGSTPSFGTNTELNGFFKARRWDARSAFEEECGRVSDYFCFPPLDFVFRFAKCAAEKFDRESLISYTYNISYMRNSANR